MKKIGKNEKNYGIAILRVLLSFMVVLDHFYNKKKKKKFTYLLYYHIPTFFFMSFYYTYYYFTTFNIHKIKIRFERLAIPYFFWSFIAFIKNNIYFFLFKRKSSHTFKIFVENLLNGHILVVPLWFQNILILTTLIISIIVFLFKNDYLLIFQFLMILSYKFQYSGDNYRFCKKHFSVHYKLTYGRFFETFPDSLTGFFIGMFEIPNKLKLYKLRTIISCILIIIFISKYHYYDKFLGFKYGGIRKNIAAIFIFLFFFLTLNKLRNTKIKKILDIITNYTPGIYFIHTILGSGYIMKYCLNNKIETIFGCFILYLISYFCCFFLDKLIGNTKLKHIIK